MEDRLGATSRGGATALAALALILVVTAGWWALALWPLPSAAPEWLIRTRVACFGVRPDGLPDGGGWVLLIGEPVGMLAILLIVWGDAVRVGLATLTRSGAGRVALGMATVALLVGVTAAGARFRGADVDRFESRQVPLSASYPRLNLLAPPLRLVDQHGDSVGLTQFRGRRVLLAFAYAHCETACPVVVHDMLEARDQAGAPAPVILVVTIDPWRDTPQRLAHIAGSWRLSGAAHVLSGEVDAVERTVDAWGVTRSRDPRTGELIHPPSVYLLDREGRIAYVATGGAAVIADLARRL